MTRGSGDGSAPVLAGRAGELAALRDALTAALGGRGRLVLVAGEAGIGKTALARTLTQEAVARGALARAGHCYDLTETPPYGPWIEVLAGLPPALIEGLTLPKLAGASATAAANQVALFAQVHDLLSGVAARQPLLLVLEDLQWADPGSLDLLRTVARGLAELPVLVLATYRTDDLSRRHPLFGLLPLLVREADALRLDLHRLEPTDVRGLVQSRYTLPATDETRLVDYLEQHAEGNPLYIGEVLRTLEEERLLAVPAPAERGSQDSPRPGSSVSQPDGGSEDLTSRATGARQWALADLAQARVPVLLRQVMEARLVRLGEVAHERLSVAAVIGQEVAIGLWAAVAEVSEEALLDVVDAAVEAHLLETPADGNTVRFAHALFREALYDGLLPPRRRVWHRRVADALLRIPEPDPDAVAYHLHRAGDPRAAQWLVRAGERAQNAYALLSAAHRFEAAIELLEAQGAAPGERAGLLYRLARMRRYADPRQSVAYLDEAEALAAAAGDRVLAAYVGCFRGSLRCAAGEIRRGLDELANGVDRIDAFSRAERARLRVTQERYGDPADEFHYRGALVSWLAIAGRPAEALALSEGVVARPPSARRQRLGTSGYANTCRGVASAHAALGRPTEARRAYAQACAAYQAVEHHYQVGNTLVLELFEAVLPYQADDLAERRRLAREAEAAWARASGALEDLSPRFAHLPLLLVEGEWSAARALGLAATAPGSRASWRPLATSLLVGLARHQGDADLAWRLVRESVPAGPPTEPGDGILLDTLAVLRVAALLSIDAGDEAPAQAWLQAHDRWLEWSGAVLGRAEGQLAWASLHRAGRDEPAARRAAEDALASASAPRQPLALLAAHRVLGELATARRRVDDGRHHLDLALGLAEACAAPYERARVLIAQAELQAHIPSRDAARRLDEARNIGEQLGAAPLLARLDQVERRLAVPTTAFPRGLTAREVEVLRLVAEGLTDAQVAERLVLSPRTVSQHLRSVYNKLGVSSRAAATRFAIEHRLDAA